MLQLITILNRCHRFPGFVYHQARFSSDHKSIEIAVRPRKGSSAVCSRCHQPAPGYDQLAGRRFEFIPFWGFLVFLLYAMRRVDWNSGDSHRTRSEHAATGRARSVPYGREARSPWRLQPAVLRAPLARPVSVRGRGAGGAWGFSPAAF